MTEAWTLGGGSRKRRFRYIGSATAGINVLFATSTMRVSAGFFRAILSHFAGQTVPGGFSQARPTLGGLGEFVGRYSRLLNETSLTPRHASYIAAVLVGEGYAEATLRGNAVHLVFHPDVSASESVPLPEVLPPPTAWTAE